MARANTGYETTLIFRPDMNDEGRKNFVEKLKSIITKHGGEVHSSEDWGKRRLAYNIKKESRGYYVYLQYTGDNKAVHELERNMRLNEHVLRFLSVKLADDFDPSQFKRRPMQNTDREVAHA